MNSRLPETYNVDAKGNRMTIEQQDDGKYVVVTRDANAVETWRSFPHPDYTSARMTAYVAVSHTPLRSHRVGGGYR